MRLPSGLVGVVAGACCAVAIAACARANSPGSAGGAAPAMVTGGGSDGRSEIQRLDRELAAAREKLGLPEPVDLGSGGASPLAVPVAVPPGPMPVDATCHPAKTDTCSDTCTLADAICTDAGKICELARQLPGDTWAAGRCTSGDQSCTAAHARCCGCQ